MDKEVIEAKIGKYQDALSGLCGVDYAYMQGDKDVDAIIELIDIVVQQMQVIEEQKDKIKVQKKLLDIAEKKFEKLDVQVEVSDRIEAKIKAEARKEFWDALKEYMDINDGIRIDDVDKFLEGFEGD